MNSAPAVREARTDHSKPALCSMGSVKGHVPIARILVATRSVRCLRNQKTHWTGKILGANLILCLRGVTARRERPLSMPNSDFRALTVTKLQARTRTIEAFYCPILAKNPLGPRRRVPVMDKHGLVKHWLKMDLSKVLMRRLLMRSLHMGNLQIRFSQPKPKKIFSLSSGGRIQPDQIFQEHEHSQIYRAFHKSK